MDRLPSAAAPGGGSREEADVSGLSEKDRAALRRIEQQLTVEDPQLKRLLARFGRRRRLLRLPARRWLLADLIGLCLLLAILLSIIFTR